MFVYLPSCNFTATCPQASKWMKDYLAQKPDVKVAGCCRPTQKTLTADDTVLSICLTCSAITHEVSPQAGEESLWEYLLTDESFPWPDYHGEEMVIQDCWRARNKPAMQHAVRECMKRMNIVPIELEENFEKTRFDGVWLYNPVVQKNLDIAPEYFTHIRDNDVELLPPEEQKARMVEWAKQYGDHRVVTYCTACLKGTLLGGAKGVHLMQLMTRTL